MKRDAATQRQVQAADPTASTWLSANAGSGKTRVLIDRVARLLLDGVDPQNILCLTYTKAAATEMQNRLFQRLGSWAMMPQDKLKQELITLGVEAKVDASRLSSARTLFARAIETPGGLRIQTIHSFCAALLRRFPLEAGVSPQFKELDEQAARQSRKSVMEEISVEAAPLVSGLAKYLSDETLDNLLVAIVGQRKAFASMPTQQELYALFDLPENAARKDALAIAITPDDPELAQEITQAFAGTTKSYVNFASKLNQLNLKSPDWEAFEALRALFLYADGTSKSRNFPQSNHSKAVDALAPISELVHDWMDRVEAAHGYLHALDALEQTRALYAFSVEFTRRYEAHKMRGGLLDFDDLIGKAGSLLIDPNVAQWVLFRLDGGIDHILIDEAQDTSPAQWSVIRALAQEFSAGEGAQPDRQRTLFVVGDKKQSIYSFQGADPEGFDRMRDHFKTELGLVNKPLNKLELEYSFRSSEAILRTVDQVFQCSQSEEIPWDNTPHRAFKHALPGRVDLWPSIEKLSKDKEKDGRFDWTRPVDEINPLDEKVQLANNIAKNIKAMIEHETVPEEIGHTGEYNHRPITEGDILILVQRRSDIFSEIIRACKSAGLKIAGADRLKVGAELAVKDIAAVLRFLALPEDDMSLAEALKSPLFGWSEQDLFTLAHHRPDKSYLWQTLRKEKDKHAQSLTVLEDLLQQADYLRPFDLINRLLIRHDGRRKLLARLGMEAEDGIDALLSQAMGYESSSVPSLTGFLEWMQTDELTVKRQVDSEGDRIRVMTVHGAKGLEAPIVILPDTAKRRINMSDPIYPSGNMVMWATKKEVMPPEMKSLRKERIEAQEREQRRLLYVAMTRAESWLIVCAAGDLGQENDSWYNLVSSGLDHVGASDQDFTLGKGVRYSTGEWSSGTTLPHSHPEPTPHEMLSFSVLDKHPDTLGTISPSDLGGSKVLAGDSAESEIEHALARGSLVHLLLEHLPSIPESNRNAFAKRLVVNSGLGFDLSLAQGIIDDTLALLKAPLLTSIFVPHALLETEITAEVAGLGRMHGAIDRLIVSEGCVTAIDYKTNRLVPEVVEDTPEGILRQMAAYHAMLSTIWPDFEVTVAILWTANAKLMPIPRPLLDSALAHVTSADLHLDETTYRA